MDTAFIKKQLKKYRKLRRRDEFFANITGYFAGLFSKDVMSRLVKGGILIAVFYLALNFLTSMSSR